MKPADWWQPAVRQRAFRAVLNGFARPGTLVPTPGQDAMLMFLAMALDESVSLADPQELLTPDVSRLLLAPAAPVAQARFVLCDGRRPPDPELAPALGTLESPELGATVVLKVGKIITSGDSVSEEMALLLHLQGPGVAGAREITVTGLHPEWLQRRANWVGAFPLGVDLVLAAPEALVALPRTTRATFAIYGEGS